jgi:hypothetical protein
VHQQGIVFFHAERGEVFSANKTGADIWHGLEERQSVERIAADLSERYRISLDAALAHTHHFIAQLTGRCLVERRTA